MMILPLLAGCGRGGNGGNSADELALTIRTEYLAVTACSATAEITADYGQRVYEFTLDISWQKGGETVLIVVEPALIAGITARIKDGSACLEYDGISLETGLLSGDGLSPVDAVPNIMEKIASGYIAECDFEDTETGCQLWFLCRDPEQSPGTGTEAAFWFDAESHDLLRAELSSDGYTVVQCIFTDFTKE